MRRIKTFFLWLALIVIIILGLYIAARVKSNSTSFLCQITGGRWQEKDTSFGTDVKVYLARGCYYSDILIRKQ